MQCYLKTIEQRQSPNLCETIPKFRETTSQFRETTSKFRETTTKFRETTSKFSETTSQFCETTPKFRETTQIFRADLLKLSLLLLVILGVSVLVVSEPLNHFGRIWDNLQIFETIWKKWDNLQKSSELLCQRDIYKIESWESDNIIDSLLNRVLVITPRGLLKNRKLKFVSFFIVSKKLAHVFVSGQNRYAGRITRFLKVKLHRNFQKKKTFKKTFFFLDFFFRNSFILCDPHPTCQRASPHHRAGSWGCLRALFLKKKWDNFFENGGRTLNGAEIAPESARLYVKPSNRLQLLI